METTLGEKIKIVRLKQGLTLEQFGEKILGATKSNVLKWEKNTCKPNRKRLVKIARLGNINLEQLIDDEKNQQIELARKIKSIRINHGWTMEEFLEKVDGKNAANRTGTVGNWESGQNLPNKKRLTKIASLNGMSVNELLNKKVRNKLSDYTDDELLEEMKKRGLINE